MIARVRTLIVLALTLLAAAALWFGAAAAMPDGPAGCAEPCASEANPNKFCEACCKTTGAVCDLLFDHCIC